MSIAGIFVMSVLVLEIVAIIYLAKKLREARKTIVEVNKARVVEMSAAPTKRTERDIVVRYRARPHDPVVEKTYKGTDWYVQTIWWRGFGMNRKATELTDPELVIESNGDRVACLHWLEVEEVYFFDSKIPG